MRRTKAQMDNEAVAYHEAGHCVAAMAMGFEVMKVEANVCWWGHPIIDDTTDEMIAREIAAKCYVVYGAGFTAHKIHEGRRATYFACYFYGAASDGEKMTVIREKFKLSEHECIELELETRKVLRQLWHSVEYFAQKLLNGETLIFRDDADEIIANLDIKQSAVKMT